MLFRAKKGLSNRAGRGNRGRKEKVKNSLRDIAGIAMSGNPTLKSSAPVDRTAVVDTSGAVKVGVGRLAGLVDAVGQAITVVGSRGAVAHHLGNDVLRARVLNLARQVRVASSVAVVVLHQARVADPVVARRRSHTAARFLHHHRQDNPMVYPSLVGDCLNRVPNGALVAKKKEVEYI